MPLYHASPVPFVATLDLTGWLLFRHPRFSVAEKITLRAGLFKSISLTQVPKSHGPPTLLHGAWRARVQGSDKWMPSSIPHLSPTQRLQLAESESQPHPSFTNNPRRLSRGPAAHDGQEPRRRQNEEWTPLKRGKEGGRGERERGARRRFV